MVACAVLQICARSNWIVLLFLLLEAQSQYATTLWKLELIDFRGSSRIGSFIILGTESIYSLVTGGAVRAVLSRCAVEQPAST